MLQTCFGPLQGLPSSGVHRNPGSAKQALHSILGTLITSERWAVAKPTVRQPSCRNSHQTIFSCKASFRLTQLLVRPPAGEIRVRGLVLCASWTGLQSKLNASNKADFLAVRSAAACPRHLFVFFSVFPFILFFPGAEPVNFPCNITDVLVSTSQH